MDKFLKIFGKSKKIEKSIDSSDVRSSSLINSSNEKLHTDSNKAVLSIENTLLNNKSNTIINSKDTDNNSHLSNNLKLPGNPSTQIEKPNEIVLVNTPDTNQRSKLEGFYYKKYISQIQNLSISNPILVEREKMKINFDSEVMDYLINDLTMIFREKQKLIDQNQDNIINEICESRDLIGVMSGMHNEATFNYSLDFTNKQHKFITDIDYLEVIVNTLNSEVDGLLNQMEIIESKLKISSEESLDQNKEINFENN